MTWSKMINFISNGHLSRFIHSRISSLKRTGNGKLTTILTRRRKRLKWDPMDVQQSFFIVVTWGDLVLVEGRGREGGTSCTLWCMTKYGHGKNTYDGLAYHIRDRTTHRPTMYGKWPLIWRRLKIGRVLFSLHPTIYGKRPLIWSHIKIRTVLFSPHPTIYGKLPLIRCHVKIGRVLFSLATWVPPKRMMCHRL